MTEALRREGPLSGVRVVEFVGIGPGPHSAMLLSDLGAEVLRIDRPGGNGWSNPIVDRGRYTVEIDIRTSDGKATCLDALSRADVLIEGFRPGVMERLGLGPDAVHAINPRLIYARMTGWGQTGPLAQAAGHDLNYIALTGALAGMTDDDGRPVVPLNLVGDFGGGSTYLAFGVVAALFERERSQRGQVIDAAIVDGVASMMTMFSGLLQTKALSLKPDENMLGGRAHFYRNYRCKDGKYVAIGALEPQFYALLLDMIGAEPALRRRQNDHASWTDRREQMADIFAQRTQAEWCALLEGSDACFAPVLTYEESLAHPHMRERATYVEADGVVQAAPAPRFSRTPGAIQSGGDGVDLLKAWRSNDRRM